MTDPLTAEQATMMNRHRGLDLDLLRSLMRLDQDVLDRGGDRFTEERRRVIQERQEVIRLREERGWDPMRKARAGE